MELWSFVFAVLGFWQVQFSNGRLGASHSRSDSVMLGLVSSFDLVSNQNANRGRPLFSSATPPFHPVNGLSNKKCKL